MVVTQGACIMGALIALLGWPSSTATSLKGIDNCGWVVLTELEEGGRLRLVAYNQQVGPAGDAVTNL